MCLWNTLRAHEQARLDVASARSIHTLSSIHVWSGTCDMLSTEVRDRAVACARVAENKPSTEAYRDASNTVVPSCRPAS